MTLYRYNLLKYLSPFVLKHYKEDERIIYEVSQKSFGGNLQLRFVFENDIIENITVISHNDSYFNLIIDNNYIEKLITFQQKLDSVDTVSGATISSSSLKDAIIKTKKEYDKLYEK